MQAEVNTVDMLQYYRIIGELKESVSRAANMDEALRSGIALIAKTCNVDLSVVWYGDKPSKQLNPFYWMGPIDLSSKHYSLDEGPAAQCFAQGSSVALLEYEAGQDPQSEAVLEGLIASSILFVPFSSGDAEDGLVQFVKCEGRRFLKEEADVCEIFTLFLAMCIREEAFQVQKERGRVILSARGICKSFENGDTVTQVLKGVNLDIYEGEVLAILGESGCGKSTFLNIIGGMDSADEGQFSFMDKPYEKASDAELTAYRRDNIGFIFQSYNLMPNLTAKQNLDLIGELVSNPMDSDELLEMVGLSAKRDNYPAQLSGGQQQRVSIARALVKRPKIIFADEPTAALDYATSIEVLGVMEKIIKTGSTLVMVTHNEEITRMADRVVRMRGGRVHEITVNKRVAKASELVW